MVIMWVVPVAKATRTKNTMLRLLLLVCVFTCVFGYRNPVPSFMTSSKKSHRSGFASLNLGSPIPIHFPFSEIAQPVYNVSSALGLYMGFSTGTTLINLPLTYTRGGEVLPGSVFWLRTFGGSFNITTACAPDEPSFGADCDSIEGQFSFVTNDEILSIGLASAEGYYFILSITPNFVGRAKALKA